MLPAERLALRVHLERGTSSKSGLQERRAGQTFDHDNRWNMRRFLLHQPLQMWQRLRRAMGQVGDGTRVKNDHAGRESGDSTYFG